MLETASSDPVHAMTVLDILAILLVLSALFGIFNHMVLRLPHTVGLVVMGLAASLATAGLDALAPALGLGGAVQAVLLPIDFRAVLMDGFLSALLFAGALHVNLSEVIDMRWAVGLLSTAGVLISTAVIGVAIWVLASAFGTPLPLLWALAFGALISPTDPVAVLAMLKTIRIPPSLQAKLTAEALFNDGVGVVTFTILLAAAKGDAGAAGLPAAARLFVTEAAGGAALGLAAGWAAYALMKRLDEHMLEVMLTLALVASTYTLALHLGISGPIAVVAAGVLIGNHGAKYGMSDATRQSLFQFWDLADELLNSVLFLLIGLEVLLISHDFAAIGLALAAVPVALAARFVSVALPLRLLESIADFSPGSVAILTWAGLRGGISVALALSVPDGPYRAPILTASYVVVVFTILVQGTTMPRVVRRYYPAES